MENFNKNIDQLFSDESKKAEENTTFPSFEKVWEKVENRLDGVENTTKKRIIPIWLPYSIAASLVFTFGIMYFFNQKEDVQLLQGEVLYGDESGFNWNHGRTK